MIFLILTIILIVLSVLFTLKHCYAVLSFGRIEARYSKQMRLLRNCRLDVIFFLRLLKYFALSFSAFLVYKMLKSFYITAAFFTVFFIISTILELIISFALKKVDSRVFKLLYFVAFPVYLVRLFFLYFANKIAVFIQFLPVNGEGPLIKWASIMRVKYYICRSCLFNKNSSSIIESFIYFSELDANDLMIGRHEVPFLSRGESCTKAKNEFESNRISHLPIFKKDFDNVIGAIDIAVVLKECALGTGKKRLADFQKKVVFAPGTNRAIDVLRLMYKSNASLAVILDEYGGTKGVMIFEELADFLLLANHRQIAQDKFQLKKMNESGNFQMSGNIRVSLFNFLFDSDLDSDMFYTISGKITEHLNSLPKKNMKLRIGNMVFEVTERSERKIKKLIYMAGK